MTIERLYLLRQATMELRYPVRFKFLDVAGELLDSLGGYLPDVLRPEYTQEEIHFLAPDEGIRIRVGPALTSMNYAALSGEEFDEGGFMEAVEAVTSPVVEQLGIEELDRFGLRSFSVLAFDSVDAAVSAFRATFFDYYEDPLGSLGGKPKQVQLTLHSQDVRTTPDVNLSGSLTVSPVHMTPEIAADLGTSPDELGGGWVLDADVYVDGSSAPIGLLLGEGIQASKDLLADFRSRLEGTADAIGA